MRRRDLLTQVLFVNLLLIVAAVVTAAVAANPGADLFDTPGSALVLGFAVGADDPLQRAPDPAPLPAA